MVTRVTHSPHHYVGSNFLFDIRRPPSASRRRTSLCQLVSINLSLSLSQLVSLYLSLSTCLFHAVDAAALDAVDAAAALRGRRGTWWTLCSPLDSFGRRWHHGLLCVAVICSAIQCMSLRVRHFQWLRDVCLARYTSEGKSFCLFVW